MKGYPIKYYTNNECLVVQCQLAIVRIFSFDERWNVPFGIQLGCRLVEWNIPSFT
jgi:hypothetical protein